MDSAETEALAHVSRETSRRLLCFKQVFDRWQKQINLVAPSTLNAFWTRHVADSLQLARFAPSARTWVDLGSGGGFPGLVLAALRSDDATLSTILIESNGKKAAFLREAARRCRITADIRAERLEAVLPALTLPISVVSARALAPLGDLVRWTTPLLKTGTMGLFLKGRDATAEMQALKLDADLHLARFASRIDADASIIAVWNPGVSPGPVGSGAND